MRELGFISPSMNIKFLVAEQVEDIIPMLRAALEPAAAGDKLGANGIDARGL